MDRLSKKQRSRLMSKIKSKNTKLEMILYKPLMRLGFEYQPKGIYGHPDYAHINGGIAVFIDGCFFHACPVHYKVPKTNTKYWLEKFGRNRKRDMEVMNNLTEKSWKVIRIWGHYIKKNPIGALILIKEILDRGDEFGSDLCRSI